MKIRNYKKKLISLSVILIIVGISISAVGFGLTGFNINKLEETGTNKWYRTFHVEDGSYSLGINLGDDSFLTHIGN